LTPSESIWIVARNKATTTKEKKKKKYRDRLVYMTSILALLLDASGFGIKKARIFFEWGLAAFTKVFHFSLFTPLGLPACA
jgi:hypothetical protein